MSQHMNGEVDQQIESELQNSIKQQMDAKNHNSTNGNSSKVENQECDLDSEQQKQQSQRKSSENGNGGRKLSSKSNNSSSQKISIKQDQSLLEQQPPLSQRSNQNHSENQDSSPISDKIAQQNPESVQGNKQENLQKSASSFRDSSPSQANQQLIDGVIEDKQADLQRQQSNQHSNLQKAESEQQNTNQSDFQIRESSEQEVKLHSSPRPSQKNSSTKMSESSKQQQEQLPTQEKQIQDENIQEMCDQGQEKVKKAKIPSNKNEDPSAQAGKRNNGNGDVAQGISLEIYKMVDKISEDLEKQKETNKYLYEEMKELQQKNSHRSGDKTSRLSSLASINQSPKYIQSEDICKEKNEAEQAQLNSFNLDKSQQQQQSEKHQLQTQQKQADQSSAQFQMLHPNNKLSPQRQTFQNNDQQTQNKTEPKTFMQNQSFPSQPSDKKQIYSSNISRSQMQQQSPQIGFNNNNQYYGNMINPNVLVQSQNFDNQSRIIPQHHVNQSSQNFSYNFYNGQSYDHEKLIEKLIFLQKENDSLNKENAILREKNEYYQQRLKQIENDSRNQFLAMSLNKNNQNNIYNFSSASSSNGSAIQLNPINGSYSQFTTPLSDTNKKNLSSPLEPHYFLSASRTNNQNDNSLGSNQSLDSNLIKKLCEILCVESPEQLIPVAKKYEKCIQSIPKLEAFITQIYNLVLPESASIKKNLAPMKEIIKELTIWKEERLNMKQGQSQLKQTPSVHQSQSFNNIYSSVNGISPRVSSVVQQNSNSYREYINFYQSFMQIFQIDQNQKDDILQNLYSIRQKTDEYHKFILKVKKILDLDPQIRDDLVLKIAFDKLQQYPVYRQFTKSLQKHSGISDLNKLHSQIEKMLNLMQNKGNYPKNQV
ncbi:hypothetical protein TTHERM_00454050 (macronuclear) [Tetrahymena thermophila SB210]|uniref:Uncharacterized protein n=1 Tax=Tetrahymena thermophila (strain SB210) TaxID=312017 RepID=Q238R1_TETTS|nr:hypothetical protein TTHERM_00454050 [Tetrahymena thermophila SB210]EAR93159.2 hypothetical protein TTHERM_00454050 [Tetrahymena thermophila SB210]|eukprot:XP_001013404.2 hypothetical protein TTHERM_00454050 [Tetrahymena thermophila SB210]